MFIYCLSIYYFFQFMHIYIYQPYGYNIAILNWCTVLICFYKTTVLTIQWRKQERNGLPFVHSIYDTSPATILLLSLFRFLAYTPYNLSLCDLFLPSLNKCSLRKYTLDTVKASNISNIKIRLLFETWVNGIWMCICNY